MMMMMMQKMSAMQADLSCQSPAERQKAAESPVKIDQLREFESTVRHLQSTWRSRLQIAGFQLLQQVNSSLSLGRFAIRLAFLHWDQCLRSLKGKNLRTPSLYVRQSTAFVPCQQDEVATLKTSIEKLNDQCLQLEMTRDNATDVLDTAMEEFRKYLGNVQGEFAVMQKRLVGSSLKLCIQQNLHLGKIGIIRNLRNWQVTAADDKRAKIEEVLQSAGSLLTEYQTKFWEFAGFEKWRTALLHSRLGRQEQTAKLRQMPLLAKSSLWHVAAHAVSIWSARHQLTVVAAKSRVAILTQIFNAVRKAKFKAVITTWACLCKNSSFKIRRACAYWSQFWQGFRQHKILMVLPRLWCWHSAVVADRLASANQVILELEGNNNKLEVQLEETRVSSHTAESEATSVAQQAVLVAEKAEQQRSLSEVHRKRCEAAMDQLAVQAKAREEKFTNQLEAANLMLDCTNQTLEALEAEHAAAHEALEEQQNNDKTLEESNTSNTAAHESEVRVMRQLWKQAEHERALLAKITDQVDNSKKPNWSNATHLSMLKSKKQRISQVAASLNSKPGIGSIDVLNGELLTICDELHEAAMLATSCSPSDSFQPPVSLITA